jgi:hypothetical protein
LLSWFLSSFFRQRSSENSESARRKIAASFLAEENPLFPQIWIGSQIFNRSIVPACALRMVRMVSFEAGMKPPRKGSRYESLQK